MHLIKQHKAIIIINTIANMIVSPVIILFSIINNFLYSYHFDIDYGVPAGILTVTLISAVITPFIVFNYLYSKADLDTYFALPIKRKKLFSIQFIFSYLITIVPALVANYLAFIIVLLNNLLFARHYHIDIMSNASLFLQSSLILIIVTFVIMLPSIISIICTTSLFNGLLYTAVIHCFPYVFNIIWRLFDNDFFGFISHFNYFELSGFSTRNSLVIADGIPGLELIPQTYAGLFSLWNSSGALNLKNLTNYLILFIHLILAIFVFFLILYFYKHRRVERIQSDYMYKFFYPILINGFGSLILVGIFNELLPHSSYSKLLEIALLYLIGFAVYYIVSIIRFHGWPKFLKTLASYSIVFFVSMSLTFVLSFAAKHVRSWEFVDPQRVTTMKVYCAADELEETKYEYSEYFYPIGGVNKYIEFNSSDKNKIKAMIDLQSKLVSQWNGESTDTKSYLKGATTIQVFYLGEKGRLLQARVYALTNPDDIEALAEIIEQEPPITKSQPDYQRSQNDY